MTDGPSSDKNRASAGAPQDQRNKDNTNNNNNEGTAPATEKGGSLTRGLREKLGKVNLSLRGGNKSKRHSTPRNLTSAEIPKAMAASSSSSSSSSAAAAADNAKDRDAQGTSTSSKRSMNVRDSAASGENSPFRIKFVNKAGDATMVDVYPNEEFEDLIHRVTEKLRMPKHGPYVLMYTDHDSEEIGVACTDNLHEMFNLFEPGSKYQLKIVPFN
ncbi:hypothetical protein GGI12_003836, partial [Dipsacomyces acuminosporus]